MLNYSQLLNDMLSNKMNIWSLLRIIFGNCFSKAEEWNGVETKKFLAIII